MTDEACTYLGDCPTCARAVGGTVLSDGRFYVSHTCRPAEANAAREAAADSDPED